MTAPLADGAARLPFLLEIGSDELPARFQPPAAAFLEAAAARLLADAALAHGALRVHAAPRRLALLVEELAVSQPTRTLEIKGPPMSAAYDEAGAPTPAALGFARKNGVELDGCHMLDDGRGRFLAVRRAIPGRPAAEVLAEQLPAIVLGIPFPKTMRWGDGEVEYARPLQWVVALLGAEIVPLAVGAVAAGRTSRGHRTLAEDRPVEVARAELYLEALRAAGVVADQAERRRLIEAGLDRLAAAEPGARWLRDEELLDEVVHLCEHPTALAGGFDERFFALPPEVITTALRAHQRYFAVIGEADGRLRPRFLTVRDGGERSLDAVRRGNERVLRARLADALFYWEFDQRQGPDAQAARLDQVTWLEGYGSLGDRTRRLVSLAPSIWAGGIGDGGPAPAAVARAAAICKSDLVSEMIKDGKEFTRLEGIIGAHYARRAGESEQVCRAIERHYLPRGAAEELPGDRVSSALAAADRLDLLAGCWLAGFAPTGAKDPYALRRHALAIVRIALDLQARISLRGQLRAALALYADLAAPERRARAAAELADFFRARLTVHLEETLGRPGDAVRAILAVRDDDPTDALAWIDALAGFRGQSDFLLLATGFKRCQNILEGSLLAGEELEACLGRWLAGGGSPDGAPLAQSAEPAENELRLAAAAAAPGLLAAERSGRRVEIFRLLSGLGPAIDRFFDSVRVNVPDPRLRAARHAFLREIHGLFARYADFAALAPPES